jgi:hypothetical protein
MCRLLLMAMLFVASSAMSARDTAYISTMEKLGDAKRDILSSRVKSARDAQVNQLVKDMNRSIAEADKFIQLMEKEPA